MTEEEGEDMALPVPSDNYGEFDLLNSLEDKLKLMDGEDHEKAMDSVYEEMLDHARSIMDLAYNTDERSRRGLLEIGTSMYKNVMDAKNSKRDSQLKLLTLIQSQRRLEFEKNKWRMTLTDTKGQPVSLPGEIQATAQVIEADRNDIIKQMIASKKDPEEEDDQ
jgi:hypothetical protein